MWSPNLFLCLMFQMEYSGRGLNKADKMNTTCVPIDESVISNFLMGVYIVAFILGLTFNLLTLGPIIQQVSSCL